MNFRLGHEVDGGVRVEHVPIELGENELVQRLPRDDRDMIERVLRVMIAAARHRRLLTTADTAETVRDAATETVRFAIDPVLDVKPPALPYYDVVVSYPLTLAATFEDVSHIYGAAHRYIDAAHFEMPAHDPENQRMVMRLRLHTCASGGLATHETVIYSHARAELHMAAPFAVPLGGLPFRRLGSGSSGEGGVGSASNSPLVTGSNKRRRLAVAAEAEELVHDK